MKRAPLSRPALPAVALWTQLLCVSGCSCQYNLHDRYTFGYPDAGTDAGIDAGVDAGEPDAAADAGPVPGPTEALFPWNGYATGSVHVPRGTPVVDHPLKPKLMWHPVGGAERYQVQMEADCPVAGFRACTFPDPEVDEQVAATTFRPRDFLEVPTTAPVGRRYVWRVRACSEAGCGAWSEPRYLDVGRHADDFNGDGYADLVVGARFQENPENNEGNVFVYYGGLGGLPLGPSLTLDNPADDEGGLFGSSVASVGDVNGDGYADLAVGASSQSDPEAAEGNAFVFYGGPSGIRTAPSLVLDNPADQAGGHFGQSVAGAGDVNGDGYADLVVGAYWQDDPVRDEGNAFVYYGALGGLPSTPDLTLDNPADLATSYFGISVASAGDVNGDGYADLAVGASFQDNPETDEGNAFLYHGGPSGLSEVPARTLDNPADQESGTFGISVACVGDANGDGYADLVVGAFGQSNPEMYEGNAFVYYGSPSGVSEVPDLTLDNPADQAFGAFGHSAAGAGDVNGDGYSDLVVGADGQSRLEADEGNAFVYYGSASGLLEVPHLTLDNPADQAGGRFGASVSSAGDVNGDGYADLAVGATGQDNPEMDEGNVFVFYGAAGGVSEAPDLTLDNPADQAGGRFGNSVN